MHNNTSISSSRKDFVVLRRQDRLHKQVERGNQVVS